MRARIVQAISTPGKVVSDHARLFDAYHDERTGQARYQVGQHDEDEDIHVGRSIARAACRGTCRRRP